MENDLCKECGNRLYDDIEFNAEHCEDCIINVLPNRFTYSDVIIISEYVRVGVKCTPTIRTKVLVDEWLEVRNENKQI